MPMHVKVRVRTDARREAFEEAANGSFRVSVKERAERGAANRRVIALVAAHFRVPQKAVRILTGQRSPSKLLEVREVQ